MSDRFDHTLEHTLKTKPDDVEADGAVTAVRRIELITGTGRRRQWSEEEKAHLVIESLKPGANVSEVARRNGLSPQQLFGWRREARALMAEEADALNAAPEQGRSCKLRKPKAAARTQADPASAFASVVIAAPGPPSPPSPPTPPSGSIEIAIGDAVVRVVGQVEPATLTAVLRAVRRAT